MTDIADRLRAVREVLRDLRGRGICSESGSGQWMAPILDKALADFPDPDAVGTVIEFAFQIRAVKEPAVPTMAWDQVETALAKLQEKTNG
jgi:hypothetical protein